MQLSFHTHVSRYNHLMGRIQNRKHNQSISKINDIVRALNFIQFVFNAVFHAF